MSLPGGPVASSVRWSFAAELVSRAGLPVAMLVLARLLAPQDFGVVTAAVIVVSFSQIFWDAGLCKALVRMRGDVSRAANTAAWINLGLAAILALGLLASADAIAAAVFADPRVAPVLRVMTLGLLFGAAGAVPLALLQRDLQFRKLFAVNLLTGLFPMAAAVPLAFAGMGYWSLVAGGLAGQCLATVALWRAAGWRLGPRGGLAQAAELLRFGGWAAFAALLGWGFSWADALVVGMWLGAHDLGVYRTAGQLVLAVFGALFSPVLPVLYSHLSSLQDDAAALRAAWERVTRTSALVALPVSFALAGCAFLAEAALFDVKWSGIGSVIALLALTHGFAWLVGSNGEAYRAVGKPHFEALAMLTALAVYLPAYWIFVQRGLDEFLWARFAVTFWGMAVHLWFAHRALGVRAGPQLGFWLMVAAASSPLLLLALVDWRNLGPGAAAPALAALALFAATMALLLRTRARQELHALLQLAGRRA